MKIITIGRYQFESNYLLNSTKFNDATCVYVISTNQKLLDVDETDQLGTRLSNHGRKDSWHTYVNGLPIYVSVHQETNQQAKLSIKPFLRSGLNPACGDR